MSKIYKKPPHCKGIDDHQKYLSRITKTLYYGKLPKNDMLSLPVTELAVELFSEAQKGKSLDRLHCNTAAQISRNACVSPCSLVLAMLYLDRLKKCNMEYLERTAPSDLFLVSLMVSSKFIFDDGETDEVFMDEWAASAGMTSRELILLERDFLKAIDWEIYVNKLTFWKKLGEIEAKLAKKEGKARGHFTYIELQTLADTIDIHNIVQCVVAVSVILAATYTAGLLTLLGSVFLASHVPGTSLYQKRMENCNILPIEYEEKVEEDELHTLPPSNETKTEQPRKCYNIWNLNALKVLKASILLASIKTGVVSNFSKPSSEIQSDNIINDVGYQDMSWDWWNIPVMNWLSQTSEYIENFQLPVIQNYLYYLETKVSNEKYIYLEDHIHKATKTRIQDQLEGSWHAEWTDTIKYNYYNILPYLQNIKA